MADDDDIWNLILGNSNGSAVAPFANGFDQTGAGAGSPSLESLGQLAPPSNGMNLDPAAMLSLMDSGVGASVIADMLPQLDTGLPSRAESLAYVLRAPLPGLDLSPATASAPSLDDSASVLSSGRATSDPNRPTPPEQNSNVPKVTSDAARHFIQGWEGYKDHVYNDAAGYPSFGYGHKLTNADNTLADHLTRMTGDQKRALADSMFDADVENHEQALYRQLGPDAINALTQNQFDALVAASYNGGVGPRMIGDIKSGDSGAAAGEFNANYVTKNVNGVPTKVLVPGLQRRNAAEEDMFVNGDYSARP